MPLLLYIVELSLQIYCIHEEQLNSVSVSGVVYHPSHLYSNIDFPIAYLIKLALYTCAVSKRVEFPIKLSYFHIYYNLLKIKSSEGFYHLLNNSMSASCRVYECLAGSPRQCPLYRKERCLVFVVRAPKFVCADFASCLLSPGS